MQEPLGTDLNQTSTSTTTLSPVKKTMSSVRNQMFPGQPVLTVRQLHRQSPHLKLFHSDIQCTDLLNLQTDDIIFETPRNSRYYSKTLR